MEKSARKDVQWPTYTSNAKTICCRRETGCESTDWPCCVPTPVWNMKLILSWKPSVWCPCYQTHHSRVNTCSSSGKKSVSSLLSLRKDAGCFHWSSFLNSLSSSIEWADEVRRRRRRSQTSEWALFNYWVCSTVGDTANILLNAQFPLPPNLNLYRTKHLHRILGFVPDRVCPDGRVVDWIQVYDALN